MCTSFCIVIVSMAFLGHTNVMVFAEAASGVVRILTPGATWVGRFIPDVFHICNEHFEVISPVLLAYRAAIQDGGLLKAGKALLYCKIDCLLPGRLETG